MAQATATDVVSLAEIKRELRFPASETSQDDLLTSQIEAAVGFMARPLGAPLVDRTIRLRGSVGGRDRPVTVRQVGLRSVSAIRYWSESGDFRDDPDGTVAVADLGRVYPVGRTCLLIWPPAAGWPDTLENSNLQVDLVQGIELTTDTDQLRQAVVLMVRFLYLGPREYRSREAFNLLLDNFRYRGPILPEPEIVSAAPGPTPPPVTTHTLYALVTADSATPTAAQFLAATMTTANDITVPAHAQGYLHFADTRSSLSDIKEQGSAFSSRAFFSATPAPLTISGVEHYVYTSKGALFAHGSPQAWELTS